MRTATHRSPLILIGILLGIALAAVALGPSAGQANADTTTAGPSTLTGERFVAANQGNISIGDVTIVEASCNRAGTSTIRFTATGVATGPYPGTFTESGTVTLGPAPGPGAPTIYSEVTSFEATFSINSAAGQVTGRKFLANPPGPTQGQCSDFSQTDPESFLIIGARYEAEISTPGGTFRDRGVSPRVALIGNDVQSGDPLNSSTFEEFEEDFSSDLLAPERVQGVGGDDDDGDDGGNDGGTDGGTDG